MTFKKKSPDSSFEEDDGAQGPADLANISAISKPTPSKAQIQAKPRLLFSKKRNGKSRYGDSNNDDSVRAPSFLAASEMQDGLSQLKAFDVEEVDGSGVDDDFLSDDDRGHK